MSDFWDLSNSFLSGAIDRHLSEKDFEGVRQLTDVGRAAGALPLPVEAGTKVVFAGTLGAHLTYDDVPAEHSQGEVVNVKSANGDVTHHDGKVFVKWDDGKFRPIHAEHLRLASEAKAEEGEEANALKDMVKDVLEGKKKEAGCEKLPEGPMRDNCEKKKEEGDEDSSKKAKEKLPEELKKHQFTSEDNPNPKGNDKDGDGETNEPSPVKGKKAASREFQVSGDATMADGLTHLLWSMKVEAKDEKEAKKKALDLVDRPGSGVEWSPVQGSGRVDAPTKSQLKEMARYEVADVSPVKGKKADWEAGHRAPGGWDPGEEEAKEKYPWDECIADQMKEYGDKETAEKVCGAIKYRSQGKKAALIRLAATMEKGSEERRTILRMAKDLPDELKKHQFTSEDNPNPKGNDKDGDGESNEPSPLKGKKAMRIASLGDLTNFMKIAEGVLIHKSTNDLWSFSKDADGFVVSRLFDDTGEPLKG